MAIRIDWDRQALYDIRRGPAIVGLEETKAQEIADRAMAMGKGTYAVGSRQGRKNPQGRWHTSVATADAKAMAHNNKHNVLLRAMEG